MYTRYKSLAANFCSAWFEPSSAAPSISHCSAALLFRTGLMQPGMRRKRRGDRMDCHSRFFARNPEYQFILSLAYCSHYITLCLHTRSSLNLFHSGSALIHSNMIYLQCSFSSTQTQSIESEAMLYWMCRILTVSRDENDRFLNDFVRPMMTRDG